MRLWLDSDAETLFKYASDPDVGPRSGWLRDCRAGAVYGTCVSLVYSAIYREGLKLNLLSDAKSNICKYNSVITNDITLF